MAFAGVIGYDRESRLQAPFRPAMLRFLPSFFASAALLVAGAVLAAEPAKPVRFGLDVLPILSDNCFFCHGPDEKHREAELRLDVRDSAIEHDAIVPGKSEASELVRRLLSTDADEQMPPPKSNRKVSPEQIAILKRWIDEGAVWGTHWAYETPQRPSLPAVKQKEWIKNPIDAFILARLEEEKLAPSPEADPATLCRRLYLDLTGLPPTAEEVKKFVEEYSEKAYDALVDKLLASPRYGERWAWDWLDAARYADSSGYQGDPERTMWPWRDWVVRSINDNVPYDQFTIDQLAGDLRPDATLEQKLATGFNRNHMFNAEGGRIPEETRVENVMDRTETTGTVWLGLTVGCARCHDHKFDPLTNREYYQLYAYFNNTSESGAGRGGATEPNLDVSNPEDRKADSEIAARMRQLAAEVDRRENELFPPREKKKIPTGPEFEGLPTDVLQALTVEPEKRSSKELQVMTAQFKSKPDYAKLLAQLKGAVEAREKSRAKRPVVMVMDDLATPRATFMLAKGAYDKPGEKVTPGVPASLSQPPKNAPNNRLGLAEWIVDPKHPLTSRVTVNRYWQAFFGMGLVKTADDFGVQGELPSHPELLDWLATEFIASKWDVKKLHRLVVTSAAYRQSSKVSPKLVERDPENRLLARGPRYRLPSWMLRDQALAIGGLLVEKLGGPPVKPYQPEGIWEEATFGKKSYVQDHGDALYRRSLYIFWRRIVGPTMFFDVSARQVCTVKTIRTNTPLHALTTLNDVTYVEAARAFGERMLKDGGKKSDDQIAWAFQRATARKPTKDEARTLAATLATLRKQYAAEPAAAAELLKAGESKRDESLDAVDHAAATALCLMILNLDEVLTKQ